MQQHGRVYSFLGIYDAPQGYNEKDADQPIMRKSNRIAVSEKEEADWQLPTPLEFIISIPIGNMRCMHAPASVFANTAGILQTV